MVALRLVPSTASLATLACTTPAGGAAASTLHTARDPLPRSPASLLLPLPHPPLTPTRTLTLTPTLTLTLILTLILALALTLTLGSRRTPAVDKASAGGVTALHVACRRGHESCTQWLLLAKAVTDTLAADGLSPLHAASRGGYVEVSAARLELDIE